MGSIPTRSRHAGAVLMACVVLVAPLPAQRADSARIGPAATPAIDTLPSALSGVTLKPPVSPTKALFQSLLIPGWGQASLDRGTAGVIFVGVEVMSVAMLVQSKAELRAAQRATDSIRVNDSTFVVNPLKEVVGKRQAAVEDWMVLIIFNHLLAAADAFVAAHLWSVPIEVHGSPAAKQATISTQLRW